MNCQNRQQLSTVTATIKTLIAITILIGCTSLWAQPAARMGISPDRYQVTFDERGGDTQSLLVQNLSDEPLSISLSVSNWDLDDDNKIRVAPPSEDSLDQWIVINPLKITIPPGSPQTIRWAIMPRVKPQAGEYRAIIFIEEDLPSQPQNAGTSVRMKMRYGLPIYAQFGEPVHAATLHDINVDSTGDTISLELSNEGNAHVRTTGNFGIWPSTEFPGKEEALAILRSSDIEDAAFEGVTIGAVPDSVILPGNKRTIPVATALPPSGEYTLQFNAGVAQLQITDSVTLSTPER